MFLLRDSFPFPRPLLRPSSRAPIDFPPPTAQTMPSQPNSSSAAASVRLAHVFVRLPNDNHQDSSKATGPERQQMTADSSEVSTVHTANLPSFHPFVPRSHLPETLSPTLSKAQSSVFKLKRRKPPHAPKAHEAIRQHPPAPHTLPDPHKKHPQAPTPTPR